MRFQYNIIFDFILICTISFVFDSIEAFSTIPLCRRLHPVSVVVLDMAKRNKQAELRQKLEEAKRQNETNVSLDKEETIKLTASKIKERNDRLRFEELLKKAGANVFNDYSSDGYLNKAQEEEEINAARKL